MYDFTDNNRRTTAGDCLQSLENFYRFRANILAQLPSRELHSFSFVRNRCAVKATCSNLAKLPVKQEKKELNLLT